MIKLVRSEKLINEVLGWAMDSLNQGSNYPGTTYEEGIMAMYDWLTGVSEDRPDAE
jgi:hypothetical protein